MEVISSGKSEAFYLACLSWDPAYELPAPQKEDSVICHLPSVQSVCRKMKPQCIFYGSAPWQETYGPWFGVVCKSSQIMEEIILCSWKGYSQISQRKILKNGLLLRGQFGMLVTILCMTKSNLILWLSKMGRCLYNVISRWQRALWILPSRLDSHYKLFSQFFCSISNSFIYVLCMHLIG